MARNWDMAASGGLKSLLDSYYAGQDRRRGIAKEKADAEFKGAEFRKQHAPYSKVTTDEYGFPNGLEMDVEGPEATRAREYFDFDKVESPAPAPAASAPQPAPAQPEEDPIMKAHREANRAMGIDPTKPASGAGKAEVTPGDPKPLIRDPKAAQAEQAQAHASEEAQKQRVADAIVPRPEMKTEERDLPGGGKAQVGAGTSSVETDASGKPVLLPGGETSVDPATGKTTTTKYLAKTGQEFGDTPVEGMAPAEPAAPAPAPQPARKIIPDDYTLKRLVDQSTAARRSPIAAAGASVDVNDLTPDIQEVLGVTPEMLANHVKIPMGIINAWIGLEGKGVAAANKPSVTVDPKAAPILRALQARNMSFGEAVDAYAKLNDGQGPSGATMQAFKAAAGLGNADRSAGLARDRFGLQQDRFDYTKNKSAAAVVGSMAKSAAAETRPDLEAIATLESVESMLQRKDTNGLRKMVPIIIERGFIPQRLTNQMISADTGLSGTGDKIEQWITGIESGEITKDNVAFFLSLVDVAKKEHEDLYNRKTARWRRAGIGMLQDQGVSEEDAIRSMERGLSPMEVMKSIGGHGGESGGAGGGKKFVPTKEELDLKKEMTNVTAALKKHEGSPEMQKKITDAFKERTGIEWGAVQKGGK